MGSVLVIIVLKKFDPIQIICVHVSKQNIL